MSTIIPGDWQSIAKAKRELLSNSIPLAWRIPADKLPPDDLLDVTTFPKTSGLFTDRELELTSTPAVELLAKLHSGTWTAGEVTKAFCKRASVAHQLVSSLFRSNEPN